jgi:hypothetical protein
MLTRIMTRVLALLLITSLALPLVVTGEIAEAKSKKKIVTRTFSSAGVIAIPGTGTVGVGSPYPSTIKVMGFKKGKILDVNLQLNNYSHISSVDIDILLTATQLPGRTATVLSDIGGGNAANVNLVLDDQAATPLPQVGPLVSGTFQPTNADPFVNEPIDPFPSPAPAINGNALLGAFEGGDPNGIWQLFVVDDAINDTGNLSGGWGLEITAKVKAKEGSHPKKKH